MIHRSFHHKNNQPTQAKYSHVPFKYVANTFFFLLSFHQQCSNHINSKDQDITQCELVKSLVAFILFWRQENNVVNMHHRTCYCFQNGLPDLFVNGNPRFNIQKISMAKQKQHWQQGPGWIRLS